MANRYYGVIPNTPENKKILEITMALDARRNVTNQPTYLWQVPLLSGEHRIKQGKSYTPMVGGGFEEMDERETMQRPRGMVSPYTQPPNQFILSGTSASYPYYNADELKIVNARKYGGGTKSGGAYDAETKREMYEARKPKTNVWETMLKAQERAKDKNDPINRWLENERNLGRANRRAKPAIAIDDTALKKEIERIEKSRMDNPKSDVVLEGAGPWGAMVSSGVKTGAKYGAKYGAQAVKTGISVAKTGASAAVAIAKNPAFQAVVTEIANDKDVQKAVIDQVSSLIKGNKTVEEVKEEATETPAPVEGGRIRKTPRGKSDGRAKRAEIVKKVMREKGMKMIEASKYVKANNLY
jgi:hypothetical protein